MRLTGRVVTNVSELTCVERNSCNKLKPFAKCMKVVPTVAPSIARAPNHRKLFLHRNTYWSSFFALNVHVSLGFAQHMRELPADKKNYSKRKCYLERPCDNKVRRKKNTPSKNCSMAWYNKTRPYIADTCCSERHCDLECSKTFGFSW